VKHPSEWTGPSVGEGFSLKVKYLATGAILANLLPFCFLIPELWALTGIYSLPVLLAERLLHLHNYLLTDNGMVLIPQGAGFLIAVPFWAVVGASIGDWAFKTQTKKGRVDSSLFQITNRVGAILLTAIFLGYVLFMAFATFIYQQ
jgi:hypothetical protein